MNIEELVKELENLKKELTLLKQEFEVFKNACTPKYIPLYPDPPLHKPYHPIVTFPIVTC